MYLRSIPAGRGGVLSVPVPTTVVIHLLPVTGASAYLIPCDELKNAAQKEKWRVRLRCHSSFPAPQRAVRSLRRFHR